MKRRAEEMVALPWSETHSLFVTGELDSSSHSSYCRERERECSEYYISYFREDMKSEGSWRKGQWLMLAKKICVCVLFRVLTHVECTVLFYWNWNNVMRRCFEKYLNGLVLLWFASAALTSANVRICFFADLEQISLSPESIDSSIQRSFLTHFRSSTSLAIYTTFDHVNFALWPNLSGRNI